MFYRVDHALTAVAGGFLAGALLSRHLGGAHAAMSPIPMQENPFGRQLRLKLRWGDILHIDMIEDGNSCGNSCGLSKNHVHGLLTDRTIGSMAR